MFSVASRADLCRNEKLDRGAMRHWSRCADWSRGSADPGERGGAIAGGNDGIRRQSSGGGEGAENESAGGDDGSLGYRLLREKRVG
jgi:hypothetical protein